MVGAPCLVPGGVEVEFLMAVDVGSLMPPDDVVKPRTPKQLRRWVLDRCDAINAVPETKRPGLFKKFYEELYPLSLFAVYRYGEQDDVICVPNDDESKDYDARILAPSEEIKLEITLAYPPGLHIQLRQLMEQNIVSQYRIAIDHPVEMALHLQLVKKAAENKVRPGGYGAGYELLVFVEDSWFEAKSDCAVVSEFLEREVVILPLRFDALHVIGRTERLHKSVVLSGHRETT